MGQAAPPVPPPQLLLHDPFNVLHRLGVAQARRDGGLFRDELLSVVSRVNPDGVDLQQDVQQLVVQGAVLSLEALVCRPALLGFVHAGNRTVPSRATERSQKHAI